jgi:hypothetical protein
MSSLPEINSRVPQHQAGFSQPGFSGRSSRTEVNAYESMDAGLTIKTREGDVVTLSTSRFSELNAREYNSQGTLVSDGRQVSASRHEREIQLATGEAFSFSVQGDLNEQELADIENIVSGIDSIIAEMAEGDMEDAFAKAMSMGSYDSVAMYEADITMKTSYSVYTEAQAVNTELPGPLERDSLLKPVNALAEGGSFLDQVASLLEAQEERALAYAQQPLSQLFDHYREGMKEDDEAETTPGYAAMAAVEQAERSIDQMIEQMVKDLFGKTLDQLA